MTTVRPKTISFKRLVPFIILIAIFHKETLWQFKH